jgi:hypothetical protein
LLYFTVTAETKLVAAPHLGVEVSKEGWPSFGQLFPLLKLTHARAGAVVNHLKSVVTVKSEVTNRR